MSNSAALALLLDGPLQSWGSGSRFTRRNTELFPTKSGIVGLLAAALGINKYGPDESDHIARLSVLRCTVIALEKRPNGRRLDVLRLEDFHTIGGGFDADEDWQRLPRSADNSTLKHPVISRRHYLLDARFGVILEGDAAALSEVAAALQNPKWGVWLGRKCCLPASPVLVALTPTRDQAFTALLDRTGYPPTTSLSEFDHVDDSDSPSQGDETTNDLPLAFGGPIGQRHGPRRVRKYHRSAGRIQDKGKV